MINIKRFVCNMLQENCYIVNDDTNECVIIDCGAFFAEERKAIVSYINDNHLTPKHLIATHGHVDHNMGNNTIHDNFNLDVEVHGNDEKLINDIATQANTVCGVVLDYDMPPVGKFLSEEDTIEFGNHTFRIIETPGHSEGSVFFYCEDEKLAFAGDTLFKGSIGRTDLPGGSMFQMIQTLRLIAQMPDDVVILPGHGPQTTIGYELSTNPYMER